MQERFVISKDTTSLSKACVAARKSPVDGRNYRCKLPSSQHRNIREFFEVGERAHPGETASESGGLYRRFLLPLDPRYPF
jgi:hypothetical protein